MIIRTNEFVHTKKYVLDVLRAKDRNIKIKKVDEVFYPYALVVYSIKMKNPKSLMNRKMLCVIDLATGRGAIGDQDPPLVEIEVDDVQVVEPLLSEKELDEKAHDFMIRTVLSKIRVLYIPEIVLEKKEYFYKMYYIIHCKDIYKKDYFLLADPMDTSFTFIEH